MKKKFFKIIPLLLLSLIFSCYTSTTTSTEYPVSQLKVEKYSKVGFDLDDTLLFSTPAFDYAFSSGVEPFSPEFWEIINEKTPELSRIKKKTFEILKKHKENGAEVYIITARKDYGKEKLLKFIREKFGVPPQNVYFTKDKSSIIEELGIQVFYGDSDSDISEAIEGGAKPVRVLRSPKSSYKKNYNPGVYDEEILPNSEE
ncbi:MAG: hypothetical protein DRI36_03205 [Caldiserica bacterium]|nr:MAG: hypothetical protein DRI36_03205 [Caldisericota bacterium]